VLERKDNSCKGVAHQYGLDKSSHQLYTGSIFTITIDNASSNDTTLEFLMKRSAHNSDAILENQFMDVRCCAHILNLIVSEGLKEVDESIMKVRSVVKYVKSSPAIVFGCSN
jgi:hypothetical protein